MSSFVPMFATHIPPPSFAPPRDVPTGPPVTVFVGNITERAQDAMIRHLLTTCGPVLSWKRVQGATGKPQAFWVLRVWESGRAGLRAIRILHNWVIGEKTLVVKVDAKTKEILDEYKAQRARRVFGKESIELDKEEEYMDESMYREDAITKERISAILHDHCKEMNAFIPKGDNKDDRPKIINQTGPKESLADVEMEEDGKRDIIHREIDKFRETMKIREAEKEEEKKKREEETAKSNGSSSRRRSPPPEREREKESRERRRECTRERSAGRRSVRKSVTRSRSRSFSPRRRDSRSSRRSRRPTRSRSRSRSRRRDRSTPPRKSQYELWKEREIEEEAKRAEKGREKGSRKGS
ncbi:RBM25 [Lepeophtheirus salmonis]|uniref:RBM25 n=1 Tax=Lepeophtheirus salmonis TaxID=72036 RepID=A0A7R8CLD7_LEPSM|nr:RBM25 [Lepeophtheirus salmonis]CAF2853120.1 RBM25 [Lepeophtheirus salmonis]